MNGLKEFFGNIPMFQKQVEREIEEKGIEPSEGIKKMEFSRQVIRNLVIGVLVVGILAFVGISYFNNKNQPPVTPTATTETKESNQSETSGEATENSSQAVQGSSDHLLKLSAKERADEATEAFESWYTSFSNGDVILEINKELLKEGSGGTSPIELQTKLIDNLKAKFGDKVSDDFYTSLQTSFNFNPVIVDCTKGLTISKAKERADEATEAFESWYTSFSNGDVILEINKELLKEGSGGTSPIELQTKLIDNLKAKFGDKVSDDFYTSLQTSFNFNPVIVDCTKGLTISKQNDDQSQWLNTWFLDTEKTEQNTKIVLRNDFPFEWVDWRNDARHREAYKNIFTQLDWDNDLSYEVVGINLTESKKNVEGVSIAFVIMKYNEKLDKWQVTGSIGGII